MMEEYFTRIITHLLSFLFECHYFFANIAIIQVFLLLFGKNVAHGTNEERFSKKGIKSLEHVLQ